MPESASFFLTPWSNFYIMTGSSAGALTGLMFVVITLVSGEERLRKSPDGISTFSTPTVVHFCAVLFISAVLSAPWHSLVPPAVVLGLGGLLGVLYGIRIFSRTRKLSTYEPDTEDWAWFTVLPFAAYALVLGGAVFLPIAPSGALFALAAGIVALTFIGIRNAWDVVTFIAVGGPDQERP